MLRLMLHALVISPGVADFSCALQKRWPSSHGPSPEDLSPDEESTKPTQPAGLEAVWSTPGVHFRQCEKPRARLLQGRRADLTKVVNGWANLPEKVQCPPSEMPIGDFVDQGLGYQFSCCKAGDQCSGCRKIENGSCAECAAGYVKQLIPVLNVSMCFQCDNIPWHDASGLTCQDYQDRGFCPGFTKAGFDQPFQGLSPSEACCACGGGNVRPTPSLMPLAEEVLYEGQSIESFPQPQAYGTTVGPGCNLAEMGLHLSESGKISGHVASSSGGQPKEIKCSVGLTQDPMRGLLNTISLEVPVSWISYGKQILFFKYWGLDNESVDRIPVQYAPTPHGWENFRLQCSPTCPWLELQADGTLRAGLLASQLDVRAPTLSNFGGLPSCDCEVSADHVVYHPGGGWHGKKVASTNLLAVQARLWRAGAYNAALAAPVAGRVGVALPPTDLQEVIPGLRWYHPEDSEPLQLPVLENASTGERFVVAPAIPPAILDVQCRDHNEDSGGSSSTAYYRWSRLTGDVTRKGQAAFNLDPTSGQVSGTPQLDLSAEGRGSLGIDCSVALGGPEYDKVLPVAVITITLVDDMCWVPTAVSGHFGLKELSQKSCLAVCRERADCAGVHMENGKCKAIVSDGTPEAFTGELLLRLNNCSEEETQLNLTAEGAKYVEGLFSPSNVFKDQVSFSRAGPTPERQLHLVHRAFAETWLPETCSNASWILLHTNASDFQNGSVEAPEFFGSAMACIQQNAVQMAFSKGSQIFDLNFLEAELENPALSMDSQPPRAKQTAELRPSAPNCPQPDHSDQGFVFGTVLDPALFVLGPCECFGKEHAQTSPVLPSSSDAVPRFRGHFNNGSVKDQLIFSGPYTCEAFARLEEMDLGTTLTSCAAACRARDTCKFYQFTATAEACTLFFQCNFLQEVGVQMVNELYGIPPRGDFCRIANPEECWQDIKRRSYLSLTPSTLPSCLFQRQYEACDALQQISGLQSGHCQRCQYISAHAEDAVKGMRKVPLPDEFPSSSQISVSCNYTSKMFAKLQQGLRFDGPRTSTVFTCVSGQWVGELGDWQHLENLTCQECIQVGTPSLGNLTSVTMPEVYFLEHRQVQVTNRATTGPHCSLGAAGERQHCFYGLEMVDTSERSWNFYATNDGGHELLLQELKFAAQQNHRPARQLVSFSQTNEYVQGCLTKVGDAVKVLQPPCKGGFVISKYSEGVTIEYEDTQGGLYFLMQNNSGQLVLVPPSKSLQLPRGAFWSLEDHGSGKVLLKNHLDFEYITSALQFVDSNPSGIFWFRAAGTADCGHSFLVALYSETDGRQWYKCGNWGNDKMVYADSTTCTTTTLALSGSENSIKFNCSGGYALKSFHGTLPAHHHDWKSQKLEFTCCAILSPPFTYIEKNHYEESPHLGNNWAYVCKRYPGTFMTGFDWHYETDHSHVYCVGEGITAPEHGQVYLVTDHVPNEAPVITTPQSFWTMQILPTQIDGEHMSSTSRVELSSCRASLVIDVTTSVKPRVADLSLDIQDEAYLSAQQRQAYQYLPHFKVVKGTADQTQVLFVCPALAGLEGNQSTLCAFETSISTDDLLIAYAEVGHLTVQKVCPVLVNPSVSLDSSLAKLVTPKMGMTMKAFSDIMHDQAFISSEFGQPKEWPFLFQGAGAARADSVGFLSIPANGDAFWGINCPERAVVVSEQQVLPHCLYIGASETQQNFTSFSGSVTCPVGSAISGWYNLPGIPVKRSLKDAKGGPESYTGLWVSCRKTSLLASCVQPEKPHCSVGHVVNAVSYSGNQFKLGCCRLQKPLGATLTPNPRKANPYQPFEGYYCPKAMDTTGSAVYEKTPIGILGEPGTSASFNWTLAWNNFDGAWVLREGRRKHASVRSNALSPVEIVGNTSFSATSIRPLGSESKAAAKSLFPSKKPTYPKLTQFRSTQADYAEYCDPFFLQSPASFQGSIAETNPCYHTFHMDLVEGFPETRGISEGTFWNCAERSKARSYLGGLAHYSTGKALAERAAEEKKFNEVQTDLELAAAIISAIPWGDYGTSAEKSTQKTGDEAKKSVFEVAFEKESKMAKFAQKVANHKIVKKLKELSSRVGKSQIGRLGKAASTFMSRDGQKVNDILNIAETSREIQKSRTEGPAADEAETEETPLKNLTAEIAAKTVPKFDPPEYEFDKTLAEAAWKDCLPLQAGLSKVMCDLFCVENSVRAGTTAVLESLQNSQSILLKNLQALLNYQTEYILYVLGTVLTSTTTVKPDLLQAITPSGLLSELHQIDFEHIRATVPSLSRDILDWHLVAGEDLYSRIAALTVNVSSETWPYRMKAAKGMLRHFNSGFHQRLYRPQESQLKRKLLTLRDDAAAERQQALKAQVLHVHFRSQSSSSLVGSFLVESFHRCHEKHSAYSMLQMKALNQMDAAIMSAQNFSKCNADTRALQEAWQVAMRADERSQEALLEAWAATLGSAERLLGALEDENLLLRLVDLEDEELDDLDVVDGCSNTTQLVQQCYARAVSALDRGAWPLLQQVITFQALAGYQEQQLKHKRLGYVPLPSAWSTMKSQLAAVANPISTLGQQLAAQALAALGPQRCPVPTGCRGLLQLGSDVPHGPFLKKCGTTHVLHTSRAEALVMMLSLRPEPLRSLSLLEDLGV